MSALVTEEVHEDTSDFEEHGHQRQLIGWASRLVMFGALAFSAYQISVAAFHPFSSLIIRSLHVSFLIFLIFMLYPATKSGRTQQSIPWYDLILSIFGFALGFYHLVFEADLIERSGDPTTMDLVVATAASLLVFEAARRVVGWALTLVCGLFLAYGFFGQYLPLSIAHRGFGFDQIVSQLYLGSDGILGTPTLVSATYIFLFILFGTFLENAGMIRLFNALALGLVGRAQGGPAKVAVISSGLMGTISGSGVANVLTVGQFTIPLMKRFGYSSVFAGAVEATSSMGGQIMPPVMGAVAFIMAETLNVAYSDIVMAAIIPAMLYYFTAFWMVHLEAGRLKLLGIPADQCPNPWKELKASWYLALPLAALVYMLFHGFTPMFAGMMGLTLTAVLILGAALAARISQVALRYVFWVAIALGASSFLEWGIVPVLGLIAFLVALNFVVKGGRDTLRTMKMALIDGAKQALGVGIACAIVGVIIGVLTLTGAASNFAGFILEVGKTSLFLSLVLTMVACIILGMGIPTIPNYIITSSIAAPALLKLGVPLIVSHMFVFYFGIMADLTPPVALAAFAAASIAKASAMKIGFKATQIAIAGFVVPFMAVYDPALMLQGDPTWMAVVYIVLKALLAIYLWGCAAIGYLWSPLHMGERIFAAASAALLVAALPATDEAGFAFGLMFIAWNWWKNRKR
ncbi:TRAP transporter permease [Sulfurospirillum diekertiae]|uniref:Sialic acid TRAP transporter large permease protein SiaM n=1 Tax=Sulfurospirillum diekertiae TaxID=1854492 RepID=A0A1Y0HJ21_9BACT|nr:TRAP transporter permease [Sulfurospirillum diekertiae]ARU48091.1 Sialic acid TRAP transporter large permease protein SiaM [Sulfurospirillum diekertiae]ASC92937.1 Sialic acid TRAP transporter large permease protein SiaM [Sulfurospirillum diekertiae]